MAMTQRIVNEVRLFGRPLRRPTTEVACYFCGVRLPDLNAAAQLDWTPTFYRGDDQVDGPICPDCTATRLRLAADGEHEAVD